MLCDCVQASTHQPISDSGFKRLGCMPGNDWLRTRVHCLALPLPLKAGRNPWSWKPEPLSVSPLWHNSSRPQRLYFLSFTLFSSFSHLHLHLSITHSLPHFLYLPLSFSSAFSSFAVLVTSIHSFFKSEHPPSFFPSIVSPPISKQENRPSTHHSCSPLILQLKLIYIRSLLVSSHEVVHDPRDQRPFSLVVHHAFGEETRHHHDN